MALIIYNDKRVKRIVPTLEKSIPLVVPVTLPTRPLNISVVACPDILGPIIENTALQIAKIITKIKLIL